MVTIFHKADSIKKWIILPRSGSHEAKISITVMKEALTGSYSLPGFHGKISPLLLAATKTWLIATLLSASIGYSSFCGCHVSFFLINMLMIVSRLCLNNLPPVECVSHMRRQLKVSEITMWCICSLTGSTECMVCEWLQYCLFILIHGSHTRTLANHIHGDTLMQRVNVHLFWYQLTKMCGNFWFWSILNILGFKQNDNSGQSDIWPSPLTTTLLWKDLE